MESSYVTVERDGPFTTITMNRPARRNALSLQHLEELLEAFRSVGESSALGVVLAGNGPVFSAGHDFADLDGADLDTVRRLLWTCTDLMQTMQTIPQVVVAKVHALATAAGCQLVASADLAVAAESAAFAAPGGKGGWFCTTPMVAIGRAVSQKHALEMALTGDTIDAATAAAWGLVNRVVPDDQLDAATVELLERATRGGPESKALGKRAFYEQIELPQPQAYAYAVEVMAAASQIPDAREGIAAFLAKRPPNFPGPTPDRSG
jgi:enoyl-CoA hydratase/carnithine racemase